MFSEGVPLPIKVLASVPALMYGTMVYLAEGTPRSWLAILGAVIIGMFVLFSYLEYPLTATWPAFVGVFLLLMCTLVLVRGIPDGSPVPFTQSQAEVWLCAILACLYMLWGFIAARRAAIDL